MTDIEIDKACTLRALVKLWRQAAKANHAAALRTAAASGEAHATHTIRAKHFEDCADDLEKQLNALRATADDHRITRAEWLTLRSWYFAGCPAAAREIDAREAVRILGELLEQLNTSAEARAACWKESDV